jgi:adenosylhomocysteine nucleosidase
MSLPCDDPCILFALARERRPFARRFHRDGILCRKPELWRFAAPGGRFACALLTGVGEQRMRSALQWLLDGPRLGGDVYRPRVVISAGFSGALDDDLRVGDLVLATEAVHEAGGRWPISAEQFNHLECRRGAVCTASRFVTRPEDKKTLAQKHGVLAVDMESAVAAELCHRHGIPFACLRVISDDVYTPLSPHLETIVANGRVSPWPLFKRLARSPALAVELWRLGRQTRIAATRLADALTMSLEKM